MKSSAAALVCVAALAAAPAFAAASALEAAQDCGRMAADAERLACYDRLFRPAPAAAPAPAGAEAEFGLSEQERTARRREAGVPVAPEAIESTVLRVIVKRPNPPVLELENGQTWRLLETSDQPPFRAGDHVTIRRGAIGSFLASAAERPGAWRVRRQQ